MRKSTWLLFVMSLSINDQMILTNYLGSMGQISFFLIIMLVFLETLYSLQKGALFIPNKNFTIKLLIFFIYLSVAAIILSNNSPLPQLKGEIPLLKSIKQSINLLLWFFVIYFAQRYIKNRNDILQNVKFLIYGYIIAITIGVIETIGFLINNPISSIITMFFHPIHNTVFTNIYGGFLGLPRFRAASSEAFQGALIIVAILPFILINLKKSFSAKFLFVISSILLFLTFSRAGYLTYALTIFLYLWFKRGNLYSKLILTILFSLLGLLTIGNFLYESFVVNSHVSNQTRLTMFTISMKIFFENFIFGTGIGNLGFYYSDYLSQISMLNVELIYYLDDNLTYWWPDPNSLFPRILAETGIIGTVVIFGYFIITIKKYIASNEKNDPLKLAILLSIILIFFQQLIGLSGIQLLIFPYMIGMYQSYINFKE